MGVENSLGYLPPKTGELFLPLSTPTSSAGTAPDSHTPILTDQTKTAIPNASDSPHSSAAVVEVGSHSNASDVSMSGHVVPASSATQSMSIIGADKPPALISIPDPQQSGTETSTDAISQSLNPAPSTKRGKGRGHGRGRGRLLKSEQPTRGGQSPLLLPPPLSLAV